MMNNASTLKAYYDPKDVRFGSDYGINRSKDCKFVLFTCPRCGCKMLIIVANPNNSVYECSINFDWKTSITKKLNGGKDYCGALLDIGPMPPLVALANRLSNVHD